MTRLALRNLASRPLRTILTTLAILLGVAMITGTYVLTDQINNGFSNIFETSFKGTAVQVEPERSFTSLEGDAPQEERDILFQFDGISYNDVVRRFAQMADKPLIAEAKIDVAAVNGKTAEDE